MIRLEASNLAEQLFLRSWWVIFFCLGCLLFFEQSQKNRIKFYEQLRVKLDHLNEEKSLALIEYRKRQLAINSQSDPAFVDLTLRKVLGVVSEGQIKIYFKTENSTNP